MAFKVVSGTGGNWSSAATWANVDTTPTIHASTNLTITSGGIFTQPFTSASSTNKVVGCVVYPVASWATRTIVFTLQENSVDTATTVTITGNDVSLNLPLRIEHTGFTQTSGRTYRYRISSATGSPTIAQSATASQVAAIIYNDQTGVPASGDFCFFQSKNANTAATLTIDDTSAICGSNAAISGATAFATSNRFWDMALQFNGAVTGTATLIHATGANTTIELKNSVWQGNNGIYTCKPTSAFTATVNWTPGATAVNSIWWNFAQGAQYDIEGAGLATPSFWKSKHVSGTGTAASPLIINTSADWTVGDYLVFHPTGNGASNYSETEYRYIITKNSATSYVLSSTSGGSENALANTHTGGYVFNDTAGKNVLWKSTDTNKYHILFNSTAATTANSILKWARIRDTYSTSSSARGSLAFTSGIHDVQYISLGIPGSNTANQLMYFASNSNAMTFRGILAYNVSPVASQDGVINTPAAAANKQFYDCHIIDVTSVGWKLQGANPYLDHCTAIACGKGGVASLYAGWNLQVNGGQLVDCEQHSNRLQGILWYGSGADVVFTRFISGTLGTNTQLSEQAATQISYQTAYFDTPTIAESTYVNNNTLMVQGSKILLKDINSTAYNNWVFEPNGSGRFAGPGLADTTAPTLGTYTVRKDPVNTAGVRFRYRQLATPGAKFITFGRIWENAAYVADASASVVVELYLPGLVEAVDTPSATVTMTKTTDKTNTNANFLLSADYAGSVAADATLVIIFKNPLASANLSAYVGDVLNAENDTTKFKNVYRGETEPIMPLGVGADPGASAIILATTVWSDTNTYTGTQKGKTLQDAADNSELAAVK